METKKKTKKVVFEATVKVLGKLFKAKGETVSEALFNLDPGNAKGMIILSVRKGGNKLGLGREVVFPHSVTARLFSASSMIREATTKQVSLRFENI